MVTDRVFTRQFTAEELDRGRTMEYHPCHFLTATGWDLDGDRPCSFASLHYDAKRRVFFTTSHGWPGCKVTYLPRIGIGKNVEIGDAYPAHWCVDPFTGEFLSLTFFSAEE